MPPVNLWLAAGIAIVCAVGGVALGLGFSRLRSPYWAIGYVIPLILVFAYALAFRVPSIMFTPPFSWMMMGIKKFAMFGFVAATVLTTPLSRIPQARNRFMIVVLIAVVVFYVGVWPFLAAIVDRPQLSRLKTNMNADGICLQTTDYTCGPAAAVTALRKLGLSADEGQIGILSCTSNQEGTPVDMLADGLQKEYGKDGLVVKCRVFNSISEMKGAGPILAVIKYRFLEDHWVTVLDVIDSEVIIGDPLAGTARMSYDEFAKRWRSIGIVLQRNSR